MVSLIEEDPNYLPGVGSSERVNMAGGYGNEEPVGNNQEYESSDGVDMADDEHGDQESPDDDSDSDMSQGVKIRDEYAEEGYAKAMAVPEHGLRHNEESRYKNPSGGQRSPFVADNTGFFQGSIGGVAPMNQSLHNLLVSGKAAIKRELELDLAIGKEANKAKINDHYMTYFDAKRKRELQKFREWKKQRSATDKANLDKADADAREEAAAKINAWIDEERKTLVNVYNKEKSELQEKYQEKDRKLLKKHMKEDHELEEGFKAKKRKLRKEYEDEKVRRRAALEDEMAIERADRLAQIAAEVAHMKQKSIDKMNSEHDKVGRDSNVGLQDPLAEKRSRALLQLYKACLLITNNTISRKSSSIQLHTS